MKNLKFSLTSFLPGEKALGSAVYKLEGNGSVWGSALAVSVGFQRGADCSTVPSGALIAICCQEPTVRAIYLALRQVWLLDSSRSCYQPGEGGGRGVGAKPMSHRACFLLKRSQRAQRNHISCCQYWASARNPKATTVAEQLPSTINLRFTVTQSFLKSLISEATVLLFSKCCIFRWNPLEGAGVKIEVWFWWMKELRCVWVLGK